MRVVPVFNGRISSGNAESISQNSFPINGNNKLSITVRKDAGLTMTDGNDNYWKDRFSVNNSSLLPNYHNSTYPSFISIHSDSTATIINYRLIRLDETRISDEDWKFICHFYNNQTETKEIEVKNLNNEPFTITKNDEYSCSVNNKILEPDSIIVLLSYDNFYFIEILSTGVKQVINIDALKNNIIDMGIASLLFIRSNEKDNDTGEILSIQQNNITLNGGQIETALENLFSEGFNTSCISGTEIERNIKGDIVRLIFTSNGLLLYGKQNTQIKWSPRSISYIYLNDYRSNILLLKTQNIDAETYNSFNSYFVAERYKDFAMSKIPVGFLGLQFRIKYEEYQTRHESIKILNIRAIRNTYKDDIIYSSDYQTPLDNSIIVVLPTKEGPPYLKLEKYDL